MMISVVKSVVNEWSSGSWESPKKSKLKTSVEPSVPPTYDEITAHSVITMTMPKNTTPVMNFLSRLLLLGMRANPLLGALTVRYLTTMETSFPGTTTTFLRSLPAICASTAFLACSATASRSASASTVM